MPASSDSFRRGNDSGQEWVAITPGDSTVLNPRPRAIMVTVAGNVNMTDMSGNTVVFPLLAGVMYSLSPKIVLSTSTTATGIIGIY